MAIAMKRPERIVSVCTNGELVARHEVLVAELESAREKAPMDARLTGNAALKKLAADVVDVEEAAARESVFFTLRALPRGTWDELVAQNPPRPGNEVDEHYGFHTDTTFDAVLAGGGIAAVKDAEGNPVEFDASTEWAPLSADLTKGQFEQFRVAVNGLNVGDTAIPFCLPAHNLIRPTAKR